MARIDGNGDSFGALLAGALRARHREARVDCPAVEMVAAYFERSLGNDERETIDRHLAGCAACRAELAALARASAANSGAQSEPRLRRWWVSAPVGWAVAGALALIVAIGLGREYYNQEAPAERLAMDLASNRPAVAPEQLAAKAVKRAAPESRSATGAPAAPPAVARAMRELQKEEPRESLAMKQAPAPPPAMPPPPAPSAFAGSGQNLPSSAGVANSVAVAPSAAIAPQTQPRTGMEMMSAPPRTPTSGPAAGVGASTAMGGMMASPQNPTFARPWPHSSVSSPDGSVRWAFGNQGAIERFGPSGMTSIHIPGVTADLVDGSAPSPSVCWIVGQGGTVLRTVDGINWEKVISPTSTDLVGVAAQSGDAAIVTTRDSQRYATSDGGQNWHPK